VKFFKLFHQDLKARETVTSYNNYKSENIVLGTNWRYMFECQNDSEGKI